MVCLDAALTDRSADIQAGTLWVAVWEKGPEKNRESTTDRERVEVQVDGFDRRLVENLGGRGLGNGARSEGPGSGGGSESGCAENIFK